MTRRRQLPVTRFLRQACPDCCAEFVGRQLVHQDSCPLMTGVENTCSEDRQWFLDNPEEMVRIRPVSRAERAELAHHSPSLPRPTHVHVDNYRWGRTRTFVRGEHELMLVLDTDNEAAS